MGLSIAKLSVALSPHYLSHDREAVSVLESPDVHRWVRVRRASDPSRPHRRVLPQVWTGHGGADLGERSDLRRSGQLNSPNLVYQKSDSRGTVRTVEPIDRREWLSSNAHLWSQMFTLLTSCPSSTSEDTSGVRLVLRTPRPRRARGHDAITSIRAGNIPRTAPRSAAGEKG